MSKSHSPTFLTVVVAALVALSPLGMDSYLPAIPLLAQEFGVSDAAIGWTVSNYLLGLALGQLIGGAFSDQLGRRPIILMGLSLFALASLALMFVSALWMANSLRLLQGFCGGVVMVSAISMVKDITAPELLAKQIAQIIFVVMITPIVAPIVGAAMLPLGWQSIFLLSCVGAILLLVLVLGWVRESNQHITGRLSLSGALAQYRYVLMFRRGGVFLVRWQALSLTCSALLGLVFVTASSPLLMGYYQLSSAEFPYAFGAFAVSILFGNRIGRWLVGTFAPHLIFGVGLWVQMIAISCLLVIALATQPPMWLVLGLMMIAIGTGSAIGPSGSAMFLNLLDRNFGSATAFETTLRFSLGALLGSVALALPLNPVLGVSLVMLGSLGISVLAFRVTRTHW